MAETRSSDGRRWLEEVESGGEERGELSTQLSTIIKCFLNVSPHCHIYRYHRCAQFTTGNIRFNSLDCGLIIIPIDDQISPMCSELRNQYLCDPQWFRDIACRGLTTACESENLFLNYPLDHGKASSNIVHDPLGIIDSACKNQSVMVSTICTTKCDARGSKRMGSDRRCQEVVRTMSGSWKASRGEGAHE
ncbi:transport inhibitor response 1-like protein [Dorcoceras hygrometricum]|uniref:Transport inhibitor response 1-like protein n=1 Tax=Dorcoceras hygrometricum TaxID=472368 RepID=A0A2Z7BH61_9LAMI|nr:transport inhibitor response 1-like protein [Dorcoceras hygrometricum]